MNYATIKNCDIANGPGVRVSLFVSGCTHRCPGCFNEVAWDFGYGEPFTEDIIETILKMLAPAHIKGLTLLGGEPFEPQNQPEIVKLLRRVKAQYPEKSIWAYSGYTFEQIVADASMKKLLEMCDVLVDGRFEKDKATLNLRFKGSENQRIIDVPASLETGNVVLWKD